MKKPVLEPQSRSSTTSFMTSSSHVNKSSSSDHNQSSINRSASSSSGNKLSFGAKTSDAKITSGGVSGNLARALTNGGTSSMTSPIDYAALFGAGASIGSSVDHQSMMTSSSSASSYMGSSLGELFTLQAALTAMDPSYGYHQQSYYNDLSEILLSSCVFDLFNW